MSHPKLFTEFPPVSTEQWEEVIIKDLKGADYEKKLVWNTPEGFKVKPYYREENLKELAYLQVNPGEYPFTRGNSAENNDWEIRQDIGDVEPSKINVIAVDVVKRGAQGIGVNAKKLKAVKDFETAFKNVDLNQIQIHFTASDNYAETLNLYVQYLQTQKVDTAKVKGSINFDFLAYALTHGSFYNSLESNIAEAKTLFDAFAQTLPNFRLLAVNAQLLHNAGSTSTQELGYALAWANDYFCMLTDAGLDINAIASRTTLHMAVGSNYFMEIAKIRAARMLWANVLKAHKAEDAKVFVHTSTSKWNKSVFDPNVNMLRTTTEAMSAALGGADSIHVDAYDNAFKDADDFSARIARNQQIILKEESYMDKIVDPAAGSYYIENLTDSLAQYAWTLFQDVEDKGGFTAAFKAGLIQDAIAETAQQRDMDIANRKITILGTNQYPNLNETMSAKIQKKADPETKGEYKTLHLYRGAQAVENIRLATEEAVKAGKKKPLVFMLTYGNLNMRKARSGFAMNFLGCAGYEIMDNAGFKTPEDGVKAALDAKADIVVLCSSDDEYPELVNAAAPALKGKAVAILAGHPGDNKANYEEAGVQEFIHVKSNLVSTLEKLNKQLGI